MSRWTKSLSILTLLLAIASHAYSHSHNLLQRDSQRTWSSFSWAQSIRICEGSSSARGCQTRLFGKTPFQDHTALPAPNSSNRVTYGHAEEEIGTA